MEKTNWEPRWTAGYREFIEGKNPEELAAHIDRNEDDIKSMEQSLERMSNPMRVGQRKRAIAQGRRELEYLKARLATLLN